MKEVSLAKAYLLLEPCPVLLVTTSDGARANVMAMSWHMTVDFSPPLVSFVMSSNDFSYKMLCGSGECVLAIPGADLMEKTLDIGCCSGRDVDKFAKFGLTQKPASSVKAPIIEECLANLECRVVDDSLAEKYNIFVVEVVKAWTNPDRTDQRIFHAHGNGKFAIDGDTHDLSDRMKS